MRATVKDVATRAGVSPKTVSNVLNGTFRVTEKTRVKVEEAMAALDYVPNLSARGLRNGRTGMIAVGLADLRMPYSAEMCHHFVESAAARSLHVQIEETGQSPEREAEMLSRGRAQLVDGLILNPVRLEASAVRERSAALPPVVLIGEVDQDVVDQVWVDNVSATRELTELLTEQGHRRIAILGTGKQATAQVRLAGSLQALRAAGVRRNRDLEISCRHWHSTGAADSFGEFLDRHDRPDAVVCMTDTLAIGAISALRRRGLGVPEDVSVVGYDNITDSATAGPPLTTVDFGKEKLADTAIEVLTKRIADPQRPIMRVELPYRIVHRSSTAPHPSRR